MISKIKYFFNKSNNKYKIYINLIIFKNILFLKITIMLFYHKIFIVIIDNPGIK